MQREKIISRLKTIRPSLEAEGVMHLAIFGSRARGDAQETSDLDILLDVKPDHKFSILDLVGIEKFAQHATGLEVNAFMRRSLDHDFVKSIHGDIVEVF